MTTFAFLITIAALVLIEGFFSGSEMALISVDRLALHRLAESGNRGARLTLELLKRPGHMLATTLVGTNVCVALTAIISTLFIYNQFGSSYDYLSVLVLSPVVLIFGELIPKTIFQRYAESLSTKIIFPLLAAKWLLAPATWILSKYTDVLNRVLQPFEHAITGKQRFSHRDELRYLLTFGQKETNIKQSERRMIRRILDFSKAEAKNALIPLIQVDMIEDTLTVHETLAAFSNYGHSRLPVYHERVDNIVGIVHVFDLFLEKDPSKLITHIMQPPSFSPESQQLERLLLSMQKRGVPMTIVVDEYGGAVGILTLEDILEEIVGDIRDEYDTDAALYRQISELEFVVQGQMEISAINEVLKLNLPKGDYETLAGFLLQQFNRIPEVGDELYFGKLKFVIRRATNKAIQSVNISLLENL